MYSPSDNLFPELQVKLLFKTLQPLNYENISFSLLFPGHCSVVQTGDEHWLVYHAWRYGQILQTPPGRMLLIDQIQWTEDQWPVVGYPSDYERPLPNVSDQYSDVYPSISIV